MLLKRTLLGGILFFSLLPVTLAQEARFKALFMYNFTKYIEWPSEKHKGNFIIGVYGNTPLTEELKIIAQKKKVGTQEILVKELNDIASVPECNIVYIAENKSSKAEEIATFCTGKGTVLITDKPGLGKTVSGLNYVTLNGRQSFEISKSNLNKQGVKVSSELYSLGIVVE